mgnify:CR=1 FL=1
MDGGIYAAVPTATLKYGGLKMKIYEKPKFDVTVIALSDVITDSAYDNDAKDADWMNIDDVFGS